MSTSYQDINTRLKQIEDKMKFLLNLMTFTKRSPSTLMPGEIVTEQITGEQLYREISNAGGIKEIQRLGEEVI